MKEAYHDPDILERAARHYFFKPMAIYFNAFQLRGCHAAGMTLESPVLDIGCSDGQYGVLLAETLGRPAEMQGVDPSEDALRVAGEEARALYRETQVAGAESLPFDDLTFKTVTANASLFAVKTDAGLARALAEIHRVLKPGGKFYATVCTDQYDQYYWLTRALNRLGCRRWARRYADAMNKRMYQEHMLSAGEWQARMQHAGFTMRRCVGFLPLTHTTYLSVLAWTPFRLNGLLRALPWPAVHRAAARLYARRFRKRFEASPPLLPMEESGYVLIEAAKE